MSCFVARTPEACSCSEIFGTALAWKHKITSRGTLWLVNLRMLGKQQLQSQLPIVKLDLNFKGPEASGRALQ